jgi:hypothetical protein
MRIVAYQSSTREDKVLLGESGGQFTLSKDIDELFGFLLEDFGELVIQVCWDLDSTVSIILRLLGEEKCCRLRKEKRLFIPPFHLFYIPDKIFSVKHIPTRRKMSLYGLRQYYPDLDVNNVEEVQMLGKKLLGELKKMGMTPTKLTSPVAIYEECVLSKLDLPGVKDIPVKCMEYAYRASGRLWIEGHKLGMFDKVFDYDLSSAFPNVAKELIDTRDCQWIESAEYQAAAIYGFVRCQVTIYDWVMVSPIIQETEAGLVSPTGTWEEYLTKEELDFITKWKIGEWKILEGVWGLLKGEKPTDEYKILEVWKPNG